jgi:hypothetical protein
MRRCNQQYLSKRLDQATPNDIRRRRPDRIQPQSESAHPFS